MIYFMGLIQDEISWFGNKATGLNIQAGSPQGIVDIQLTTNGGVDYVRIEIQPLGRFRD